MVKTTRILAGFSDNKSSTHNIQHNNSIHVIRCKQILGAFSSSSPHLGRRSRAPRQPGDPQQVPPHQRQPPISSGMLRTADSRTILVNICKLTAHGHNSLWATDRHHSARRSQWRLSLQSRHPCTSRGRLRLCRRSPCSRCSSRCCPLPPTIISNGAKPPSPRALTLRRSRPRRWRRWTWPPRRRCRSPSRSAA